MDNRTGVNPATKHQGSSIRTPPKRRSGRGHAFEEPRITATKGQPGRKRSVWMELDSDVGSQKNKRIFTDGILGPLTELYIKRGCQEINASINGKFLPADKLSIVFGSQSQARIESYISSREHCPAWRYQACTGR